jgi:hypothetical protein
MPIPYATAKKKSSPMIRIDVDKPYAVAYRYVRGGRVTPTKETTMSRNRLVWNLTYGIYELTAEQETLAWELVEMVETADDAWAARDLIAELEAANG